MDSTTSSRVPDTQTAEVGRATRAAWPEGRVCRAWHRTREVKVLLPGVRRAEGQEKGKGVTATWGLEEAQSEAAGRRTGTRYEVWHIRAERARDREVLPLRWDVLYRSGVFAVKALCPLGVNSGRSAHRVRRAGLRGERSFLSGGETLRFVFPGCWSARWSEPTCSALGGEPERNARRFAERPGQAFGTPCEGPGAAAL